MVQLRDVGPGTFAGSTNGIIVIGAIVVVAAGVVVLVVEVEVAGRMTSRLCSGRWTS